MPPLRGALCVPPERVKLRAVRYVPAATCERPDIPGPGNALAIRRIGGLPESRAKSQRVLPACAERLCRAAQSRYGCCQRSTRSRRDPVHARDSMTGLAVATRTCAAHGPTIGEASPYYLHGFSSTPSAMRVGLSLEEPGFADGFARWCRYRRLCCHSRTPGSVPGRGRDGMG